MKKLIVGILAAFLMIGGLVAAGATSASAASCPHYTGCVRTVTKAHAHKVIKKAQKPRTTVRVKPAVGGNAKPRGTVTVIYKSRATGKKVAVTVRYRGTTRDVRGPQLKPGKYKVIVRFTPGSHSAYFSSRNHYTLTVKR